MLTLSKIYVMPTILHRLRGSAWFLLLTLSYNLNAQITYAFTGGPYDYPANYYGIAATINDANGISSTKIGTGPGNGQSCQTSLTIYYIGYVGAVSYIPCSGANAGNTLTTSPAVGQSSGAGTYPVSSGWTPVVTPEMVVTNFLNANDMVVELSYTTADGANVTYAPFALSPGQFITYTNVNPNGYTMYVANFATNLNQVGQGTIWIPFAPDSGDVTNWVAAGSGGGGSGGGSSGTGLIGATNPPAGVLTSTNGTSTNVVSGLTTAGIFNAGLLAGLDKLESGGTNGGTGAWTNGLTQQQYTNDVQTRDVLDSIAASNMQVSAFQSATNQGGIAGGVLSDAVSNAFVPFNGALAGLGGVSLATNDPSDTNDGIIQLGSLSASGYSAPGSVGSDHSSKFSVDSTSATSFAIGLRLSALSPQNIALCSEVRSAIYFVASLAYFWAVLQSTGFSLMRLMNQKQVKGSSQSAFGTNLSTVTAFGYASLMTAVIGSFIAQIVVAVVDNSISGIQGLSLAPNGAPGHSAVAAVVGIIGFFSFCATHLPAWEVVTAMFPVVELFTLWITYVLWTSFILMPVLLWCCSIIMWLVE